MAEEKELTLEEMKSLVSMTTVLPALLKRINEIGEEISNLKKSFAEVQKKFNDNTNAVIAYDKSVKELTKKQADVSDLKESITAIQDSLVRLELIIYTKQGVGEQIVSKESIQPNHKKVEEKPSTKKNEEKKKEDKDIIIDIVDKILKDHKGRKTRTLTTVDIKKLSRVDDETANKVLAWFEKQKMYNPKMHILTFPKR